MTTPRQYRTVHGDMVDVIAWKHYGCEAAMTQILEANPHLADQGPMLAGGIMITLPVLSKAETTPEIATIKLWD